MFDKKLLFSGALALAFAATGARAQSSNAPIANVQTATLSAAQLPPAALYSGVVLKADTSNAGIIFVGPCANMSTTTGYPLKAGEAISYGITSPALVCMIGQNTTDILHFTGN